MGSLHKVFGLMATLQAFSLFAVARAGDSAREILTKLIFAENSIYTWVRLFSGTRRTFDTDICRRIILQVTLGFFSVWLAELVLVVQRYVIGSRRAIDERVCACVCVRSAAPGRTVAGGGALQSLMAYVRQHLLYKVLITGMIVQSVVIRDAITDLAVRVVCG